MIVSVVVCAVPFGVTDVGLNVAVVCAGKPATLKETRLVNPFAVGVTVIVVIACCPALTVVLAGPLTVNPSTVKLLAEVVPPSRERPIATAPKSPARGSHSWPRCGEKRMPMHHPPTIR